jgi:RND family efflux transporter MFP subunit
MKNILILLSLSVITAFWGCNNSNNSHGHSHDVINAHDTSNQPHDHGDEGIMLSYTLFQDNYELFVEFPVMVIGQKSVFAAHFTDLSTFKPLEDGKLTVSMVQGNKGIRHKVEQPFKPGIFNPALLPKSAGTYDLTFELDADAQKHKFLIRGVQVYENVDKANNFEVEAGGHDEVVFLKEQAWKTDFETKEIIPQEFYTVITTSAVVKADPESKITHNAPIKGSVNLYKVTGESVKTGDLLAVIKDDAVIDNLASKLTESKITYENSRVEYDRSVPLLEKQLISKKDFLEIASKFRRDSLAYFQRLYNIPAQGLRLTAQIDGYVSAIHIENGQFVDLGGSILTISNNSRLLIEAKVNQSDLSIVNGIHDANFKFGKSDEVIQLSDLNGKILTKNAFVSEATNRIPVIFSITGHDKIVPGMYIEAFIKSSPIKDAIVIPVTAVIEEQGLHYVFVQSGGESYEKRTIHIGGDDGKEIQVLGGLLKGERIVTKGAYHIKLASLAGDLPLHGHTH